MRIFDIFYLVFQSMKTRKSRTIFTSLGVALGIGTILFLVSLGYGLQKVLLERITTEESLLTLDVTSPEAEIIILDKKTLNKISEISNVEKVSPQAIFSGQVSVKDLNSEAVINIIDSDFLVLEGIKPELGRIFREKEKGKIIINSQFQALFGLVTQEVIGKKIKLSIFFPAKETEKGEAPTEVFKPDTDFEIVGVIKEEAAMANVYISEKDLEGFIIKDYQLAKVMVKEDKFLEEVRDKLIGMGFMVSALSDIISQANKIFIVIQIILGIFGVVGLIVAALGLINTMSISLLERTSEIGIMRALGASAEDIRRLFLIESTISGFLGGILGVGLGIGFGQLFNLGMNILAINLGGQPMSLFYYPVWFIIFIILLSVFVGFAAGFWPAKKASSLNPLEALRYK